MAEDNLLVETVVRCIEDAESMDVANEDFTATMNAMKIAHDAMVDEDRLTLEAEDRGAKMALERERLEIEKMERELQMEIERKRFEIERSESEKKLELEESKNKAEKRKGLADTIINGVKVVGLIAVSVWGVIYTTDFEKEDTATTTAGRNAIRGVTDLFKKM